MRCGKVEHELSAYLDEQVSAQGRLAIGLHLSRCHACREKYDAMRRLRLALLSTPKTVAAEDFAAGWRVLLRHERKAAAAARTKPWFIRPAALLPAAACLALLAAGGVLLLPHISPRPEPGRDRTAMLPQAQGQPAPQGTTRAQTYQAEGNPPAGARLPGEAVPATGGSELPSAVDGAQVYTGGNAGAPGYSSEGARTMPVGNGSQSGRAVSHNPAPAISTAPAAAYRVDLTGSWRLWLSDVGATPDQVVAVLQEAGLTGMDLSQEQELPLPICLLPNYATAQNLVYRLEEAGAKVIVENMPN